MTDIEKQSKFNSEMGAINTSLLNRRDALPQDKTFDTYRSNFNAAATFLSLLVGNIINNFDDSNGKRGIMAGVHNHLPLLFASDECFRDQEVQKTETKLHELWSSKSFPKFDSIDDFKSNGLLDDKAIEMYKYRLKMFILYLKNRSISSKEMRNVIEDANNALKTIMCGVALLSNKKSHTVEFVDSNITLEGFLGRPNNDGKQILELLERAVDYNGVMTCFEYYMATLASSNDFYINSEKLIQFNLLFNNYIDYYMSHSDNVFKFSIKDSSLLTGQEDSSLNYTIFNPMIFSNIYFRCRTITVIGYILAQYVKKTKKTPSKEENPTKLIAGTAETQKIMEAASTVVPSEVPVDEVEKLTNLFIQAIERVSLPFYKQNDYNEVQNEQKKVTKNVRKLLYNGRIIKINIVSVRNSLMALLSIIKTKMKNAQPTDLIVIAYTNLCSVLYEYINSDNEEAAKIYATMAIEAIKDLRKKVLDNSNNSNFPKQLKNNFSYVVNSSDPKVRKRTFERKKAGI